MPFRTRVSASQVSISIADCAPYKSRSYWFSGSICAVSRAWNDSKIRVSLVKEGGFWARFVLRGWLIVKCDEASLLIVGC